jgi:zinc transport system substrate-binding protein
MTLALGLLTGCSRTSNEEKIQISAGFYPLQYVAQRIGGDHVQVHNLTKAGAEPHDLELSPQEVMTVNSSKLALYVRGFQPALDAAIEQNHVPALDGLPIASGEAETEAENPSTPSGPAPDDGHDHGHDHSHEGETGPTDPHFWLDPTKLSHYSLLVRDKLSEIDPAHSQDYANNAQALDNDLKALHAEYVQGLLHVDAAGQNSTPACTSLMVMTTHQAFTHLAEAYKFDTVGILPASHDAELTPRRIGDLVPMIRDGRVSTLYAEPLVSRDAVEVLAREAKVAVATLDPIEGLASADSSENYFSLMRANLATLRTGQGCP